MYRPSEGMKKKLAVVGVVRRGIPSGRDSATWSTRRFLLERVGNDGGSAKDKVSRGGGVLSSRVSMTKRAE